MEIKCVPLDSQLWDEFRGAYGNVSEEVKIVMGYCKDIAPQQKLRRLEPDRKSDYEIAFDNLCENLWHQMSFYPATYLALPYLVCLLQKKAEENDFKWQLRLISAIGAVLATDVWKDGDCCDDEILENYKNSIACVKEITMTFVKEYAISLKVLDEVAKQEFLIGMLAILGEKELAFLSTCNFENECCFACEHCEYCYEGGALEDTEFLNMVEPAQPKEWDGISYDDTFTWYYGILKKWGLNQQAKLLLYHYGTFTCPECGKTSLLLDCMKQYYKIG